MPVLVTDNGRAEYPHKIDEPLSPTHSGEVLSVEATPVNKESPAAGRRNCESPSYHSELPIGEVRLHCLVSHMRIMA